MRSPATAESGSGTNIGSPSAVVHVFGSDTCENRSDGVCHTGLQAVDGDRPVKPKPPFILGDEGVKHAVAVGTGVQHVKEGDVTPLFHQCTYSG
ncbi:alcohol dehydrogenase catalytic domain-containing protein [Aureimonas sp. OT7]|nr:alcohol dehydrogenase catalytic domain-containing protein [Aureimonas sp. OT7]